MDKELIDQVVSRWEELKKQEVIEGESYGCGFKSCVGNFYWNNPNLLFVFATGNEEDYEGSQSQVGITKDGKLKWEYQSHCSCDDYENSDGVGEDFPPADTTKSYEMKGVPLDWEEKISENIKKILSNAHKL